MISRDEYFMGRDIKFRRDWTPEIEDAAAETVKRANFLLTAFGEDRAVNSGWRPPAVNATTPGAALYSRHMTGQAIDLYDPEGDLDEWCFVHQDVLQAIGLWMEHPASTKGWCHVQIVPPKSGRRCFYP